MLQWGYYGNIWTVDPVGKKGGLCILWSDDISLNINVSSEYWIEFDVTTANGTRFLLSNIYGPPKLEDRHILRSYMNTTNPNDDPWLLMGDFNQIISKQDKLSTCDSSKGAEAFKHCIDNRDLLELSALGPWYTWTNNRQDA